MSDLRSIISEHAGRLRELQRRVHQAFRNDRCGPTHVAAANEFRGQYDALAFPGGLRNELERLKRSEPAAVEAAVQFLEADPYFFRSGYIKEEIVRRLKHADLTREKSRRLRSVLLRSIHAAPKRVFRHYARLAPFVADDTFVNALVSSNPEGAEESASRVRHVLAVIRSSRYRMRQES